LELPYSAPPSVAAAVAVLGRTEDVRFSPSARRLAVASFHRNRVVVFDVDIASSPGATQVALTGGVDLSSPALQSPHGVDFIDDDTLIVTSRRRDVALFTLPPGQRHVPSHEVLPVATWPADRTTHLNAPGSVVVTRLGEDGCEVLVCNNDGHTVTRHLLGRGPDRAIRHSEILLQEYLDIPDGVSVSPDRRWIAVSNHTSHNVLLYQKSPALNAGATPAGILRRAYYPHGLRFSADGRHLFLADAGAPYLHIYAQDSDGWRGVRDPVATVRIMDDAVFDRGRHNPEEGGPKGLDIDARSNILVVTSECQPLAFFEVPVLLGIAAAAGSGCEQKALALDHELSLIRESRRMAAKALEAHALRSTLSWRITAPLRRLRAALRRPESPTGPPKSPPS
jgi:hypothetical protein